MLLALLTLISGLAISAVAIYYSVQGLAAIFAAAVIPIVVMGTILEVSKLVAAWWLKANWHRAPFLLKSYLLIAVVVLMLITSMGIFGFLSKAHTDQAVPAGDVVSQVALYDEKIKTQRDNIETARKALLQMDAQVDQLLGRSADERGAERAVQVRRNQARERARLQNEIAVAQTEIAKLNEQKAPIAGQLRALEAEVGPIKYIAALIYGDNPDSNVLEKAVTWVIIVIVFVFDPLAVLLLLASQLSFQWYRQERDLPKYEADNGPLTNDQIEQIQETASVPVEAEVDRDARLIKEANDLIAEIEKPIPEVILPEPPAPVPLEPEPIAEEVENPDDDSQEDFAEVSESEKAAMTRWKAEHPGKSVKFQRKLLARGAISQLPWTIEAEEITQDEAAQEAVKWATEQLDASKKKDSDLDGEDNRPAGQTDSGRVTYKQNSEQNESTLWQRVQDAKKDIK
jgi:flagellar basal body-associated protein FliL